MTDTCHYCNAIMPDKIKRWSITCDDCYTKGMLFYYTSKNINTNIIIKK